MSKCCVEYVTKDVLANYFKHIVGGFFKILPMWESGEPTLPSYIDSFLIELAGCRGVVGRIGDEAEFLSMLSILQYLSEHPALSVDIVRREVFKAIRLSDCVRDRYCGGDTP